jgi:hypothetical protein
MCQHARGAVAPGNNFRMPDQPGAIPPKHLSMDHHGDSTPRRLFKKVLALTKMNVNNADLALDGDPITIRVCQEER